jgi:hypothetical protein
MKYTIEFRDGLRYIEKEVEGRIPNIGETVWVDLNNGFYTKVCVVTEVVTDLTYSEPIYIVKLRRKDEN